MVVSIYICNENIILWPCQIIQTVALCGGNRSVNLTCTYVRLPEAQSVKTFGSKCDWKASDKAVVCVCIPQWGS